MMVTTVRRLGRYMICAGLAVAAIFAIPHLSAEEVATTTAPSKPSKGYAFSLTPGQTFKYNVHVQAMVLDEAGESKIELGNELGGVITLTVGTETENKGEYSVSVGAVVDRAVRQGKGIPIGDLPPLKFTLVVGTRGITGLTAPVMDKSERKKYGAHEALLRTLWSMFPCLPPDEWKEGSCWTSKRPTAGGISKRPSNYMAVKLPDGLLVICTEVLLAPQAGNRPHPIAITKVTQSEFRNGRVESATVTRTMTSSSGSSVKVAVVRLADTPKTK